MKTIAFSIFILTTLLIVGINVDSLSAQCVACYQKADGSCRTELVHRDGSNGCGCDSGCDCDGQCTYTEPGEGANLDILKYKLDSMDVPNSGYLIKIREDEQYAILSNLSESGYLGEETIDHVWFGNKVALYKLSKDEFLIFPANNSSFDLVNCNGELLATIHKK